MANARLFVLSACVAGAAGCRGEPPAPLDWCDPATCYDMTLSQPFAGPLLGDTVRVQVVSGFGINDQVTWSSTPGVEIVPGSEMWRAGTNTYLGTYAHTILVRGLVVGPATITATHDNPHVTASITTQVVDSSVITHLSLASSSSWPGQVGYALFTSTVRVGDSLYVTGGAPTDAQNRTYHAVPDNWTSADTAIAFLFRPTFAGPGGIGVRAKAPGTARIVAWFAGVRDTLRITVVP
jgi:hypothetical protein